MNQHPTPRPKNIGLFPWFIFLIFVLTVPGWGRINFSATQYNKTRIVLHAVGDVIPHIPIKQAARALGDYDSYFLHLKPVLSQGDINFANLETTILSNDQVMPFTTSWPGFFWAPPDLLDSMRKSGFHLLSVANNHTLDFSNAGFRYTLDAIKKNDLTPIGYQVSPVRSPIVSRNVKNIKMAFLAYTTLMNLVHPLEKKYPRVNYLQDTADIKKMLKFIELAKKNHDFVVVSMHWGKEYASEKSHYDLFLARQMHQAGADLILGHHSHVLQKPYWLRSPNHKTLILPSMGNYLANQGQKLDDLSDYKTRLSALFRVQIDFYQHKNQSALRYKIIDWQYVPLWIKNTWMQVGSQGKKISLIKPSFLLCQQSETRKDVMDLIRRMRKAQKQKSPVDALDSQNTNLSISYVYFLWKKMKKIDLGYKLAIDLLGKERILSVECK